MQIVSRETQKNLEIYFRELKRWNKVHNLSRLQLDEEKLIEEAFFVINHLSDGDAVLDVGSGNGLPGVLLSILGCDMMLCEINHKKSSFLKTVSTLLCVDYQVFTGDAFSVVKKFDVVTSKAFTSLDKLIDIQKNVSCETKKTKGIFLKGKSWREEVVCAQEKHGFDYDVDVRGEGVVLTIHLS